MLTETVRSGLKEAVLKEGWTYDAVAQATGVRKQTVYDFANDRGTSLSSTSLDRLAEWLGVRVTKCRVPKAPERSPRGRPRTKGVAKKQ